MHRPSTNKHAQSASSTGPMSSNQEIDLATHYFPAQDSSPRRHVLVVLVHGGALSSRMYKAVVPPMTAAGIDVAAPDLPGHGTSASLGPFTFEKSTRLLIHAVETFTHQQKQRQQREKQPSVVLVGVSLGGQVVLDMLQHRPTIADAAIVSGASVHPPDDRAQWEMPRMPLDQDWLTLMQEDVDVLGMENASTVQAASFDFQFRPSESLPPVLVMVGENDVAMAKRDFDRLGQLARSANGKSRSMVLQNAWHNHPIDVPDRFARVIGDWV